MAIASDWLGGFSVEEKLGRPQDHDKRKGNHSTEQKPAQKPSQVAPRGATAFIAASAPMSAGITWRVSVGQLYRPGPAGHRPRHNLSRRRRLLIWHP